MTVLVLFQAMLLSITSIIFLSASKIMSMINRQKNIPNIFLKPYKTNSKEFNNLLVNSGNAG